MNHLASLSIIFAEKKGEFSGKVSRFEAAIGDFEVDNKSNILNTPIITPSKIFVRFVHLGPASKNHHSLISKCPGKLTRHLNFPYYSHTIPITSNPLKIWCLTVWVFGGIPGGEIPKKPSRWKLDPT